MFSQLIVSAIVIAFTLSIAQVQAKVITISSPNKALNVEFIIDKGKPTYRLLRNKEELIAPSSLGFTLAQQPSLVDNFAVLDVIKSKMDNTWDRVWGESKTVRNHYNELTIKLQQQSALKRIINLVFRVYDDGIGFRYVFPKQAHLNTFAITSEETEFTFTDDHAVWSIPANYDSYEALYHKSLLSDISSANTPITLQTKDNIFISIHEAALTDYAGMTLVKNKTNKKPRTLYQLNSDLVPWPDGIKVKATTPFKSPWRTIQVADSAGKLITSNLIINLNKPSVISDTSWIKPMKYVGIWWGMHMRKYTWEAGPKHGATTENTLRYIDFAKQHNIGGVLVEGWNKGWETWHTGYNIQNFTEAYDDFDLVKIAAYAQQNDVTLIGHHETGGNIPMYEKQMEASLALYNKVGVQAIKTGYAGKMLPEGVFHHGQQMVNHYRKVLELAAKNNIMLNAHEPIKPTGIRRTYPNMMTREGGRGMEWNGWSEGNTPEHTVTLPFTRLLAGPMDYTPGIFNLLFDPQQQYRVHSTLAKQLAMYVTLYSPMQMAADMIENYEAQPAFEFIEKVPTTWDETRVLAGEIGHYISIARRDDKQWFIGSMTDEVPRTIKIVFDFLEPDVKYVAQFFTDALSTDFKENPTGIEIKQVLVLKGQTLEVAMASGGGQAIIITPVAKKPSGIIKLATYNVQAQLKTKKFAQGHRFGEVIQVEHLAKHKKVTLLTDYHKNYSAGGASALVDGILGKSDYKSLWQGYSKQDLDAIIDLGEIMSVSSIEIVFLQSILHSILLPTDVRFSVSTDNQTFIPLGSENYHTQENTPDYQQKRFKINFSKTPVRYLRVQAKNLSELPSWHVRAGQETFIFADEIVVK